jgi:hypothetical protein
LNFLYAGEGTLWTDMKEMGVRANLQIEQGKKTPEKSGK